MFGFIVYILSQSMVLFLTFILGIFNSNIMDLFKNNIQLDPNSFKLLAVIAIIIYLTIIVVMSFICKKVFNSGVNVE